MLLRLWLRRARQQVEARWSHGPSLRTCSARKAQSRLLHPSPHSRQPPGSRAARPCSAGGPHCPLLLLAAVPATLPPQTPLLLPAGAGRLWMQRRSGPAGQEGGVGTSISVLLSLSTAGACVRACTAWAWAQACEDAHQQAAHAGRQAAQCHPLPLSACFLLHKLLIVLCSKSLGQSGRQRWPAGLPGCCVLCCAMPHIITTLEQSCSHSRQERAQPASSLCLEQGCNVSVPPQPGRQPTSHSLANAKKIRPQPHPKAEGSARQPGHGNWVLMRKPKDACSYS